MMNINKEVLVVIYLNEDSTVEVEMNLDDIGQMAIIGVLEQIKYNILSGKQPVKSQPKYDA